MRSLTWWWARRRLAALTADADAVVMTYDAGTVVARTDGSVVVAEWLHEPGPETRCRECGFNWPCPMARLRTAVHRAKREI